MAKERKNCVLIFNILTYSKSSVYFKKGITGCYIPKHVRNNSATEIRMQRSKGRGRETSVLDQGHTPG